MPKSIKSSEPFELAKKIISEEIRNYNKDAMGAPHHDVRGSYHHRGT
jgi:hypothetical protein